LCITCIRLTERCHDHPVAQVAKYENCKNPLTGWQKIAHHRFLDAPQPILKEVNLYEEPQTMGTKLSAALFMAKDESIL
jgi:hypothetical protein